MIRVVALFAGIVLGLFALELTPPAQRFFVQPWTGLVAQAAGAIVRAIDPAVMVNGAMLVSTQTGFAVTILAGCNGVEAMIVLLAGMLTFPAPWKHRAAGIAAGIVAIQALNLVRIVSLFYLGQWDREAFEWAHLYLWQALVMLDALIVWMLWLGALPRPARA
jgi:exosortase H (IPTLxxWG-CTERM-specific)